MYHRPGVGAEVHQHTPVVGLAQRPDGTWDVRVENGDVIHTEHVVNAGGLWAREVGRMLASSSLVRVKGHVPQERPQITRGPDPRSLIGYIECHQDGQDGQLLSDYDLIGSEAAHSGVFALQGGAPFNFLYFPPPAPDRDLGISALVAAAIFAFTSSFGINPNGNHSAN